MELFESYLKNIKEGLFNPYEHRNEEFKIILNNFDDTGRTMLHWASFLGNKNAVFHLLNLGCNAFLVSEKDENFQAIHFAAVNNHTDCIKYLLDASCSIESCDMFKRTPLSIACFYGRINTSVFLLSKGANFDHRDMNGNTVLHFAAMSGNIDLCQILIYSGVDVNIRNDFGETTFHLASRKGCPRLLKSLLRVNSALLNIEDNKGLTAVSHAKFHRNFNNQRFLTEQIKKSTKIFTNIRKKDLFYGRGGSKYPLAFLIVTIFFWATPTYLSRVLFQTYNDWPILNNIFIIFGFGFMVSLYAVNSVNPGFLPRYTKDYDSTLKSVSISDFNESEIFVKLSRLCHSCRTVRPLRAFHCGICRRCIRDKDHHCPYIYNCVGFKNRQYFLGFLLCLWIEMAIGISFALIIFFQYNYQFLFYEYFGLFLLVIFFAFLTLVLASTLFGALRNLTTNESLKWTKYGYDYLRDDGGGFRNPFNKGYLLNFLEFFRIVVVYKKLDNSTLNI